MSDVLTSPLEHGLVPVRLSFGQLVLAQNDAVCPYDHVVDVSTLTVQMFVGLEDDKPVFVMSAPIFSYDRASPFVLFVIHYLTVQPFKDSVDRAMGGPFRLCYEDLIVAHNLLRN